MNGREVILTGLRTNGDYHLGNYIGALLPMITFAKSKADEYAINLFVPDLHSFTTPIDHNTFYAQTLSNLRLFVASGMPLDNEAISIYRQSFIAAHSQLTWILNNFSGFGELSRMVEFKDKAAKLDHERVSVGLFDYPVLMASDILLYDAKWVPVGDDQRQHLEFTRNIADRLNNYFRDRLNGQQLFTVPETLAKQQTFAGRDSAPRIRSLRDPSKKMSKSIDDPAGTIQLTDLPSDAHKKIMSATTDSVGLINYDWETQPGITNLLTILAALSGLDQTSVNDSWTGQTKYGDLKLAVANATSSFLETLHANMAAVSDDALASHLEHSEARMNEIASAKLDLVHKAVGLRLL